MVKRVVVVCALLFAALGILAIIDIPYRDGRCGAQTWTNLIRGPWEVARGEHDDEYGIASTWARAHGGNPCPFIWEWGRYSERTDTEYFPQLHFLIASGASVAEIRSRIVSAGIEELRKKDKLGRTILHWLVVYRPYAKTPDSEARATLVKEVVAKGLSLDEKDSDGLSPRDWARSAGEPLPDTW